MNHKPIFIVSLILLFSRSCEAQLCKDGHIEDNPVCIAPENCPSWANSGHCDDDIYRAYMKECCKESCGLCKVTTISMANANSSKFDYVIDVRDDNSVNSNGSNWINGHLVNAYSMIDSSLIEAFTNNSCLRAKILVVGWSGNIVSRRFADDLVGYGFTDVSVSPTGPSAWGMNEWIASQYPVVTNNTRPTSSYWTCTTIDQRIATLTTALNSLKTKHIPLATNFLADCNSFWLIFSAVLVFFMQAGFSLLEAGAVRERNVGNILYKNLMDAAIGSIAFWLFGFAFAYGGDGTDNQFIGGSNFALSKEGDTDSLHGYSSFFFQWAFAATAATIVSGSVAERTKVSAYFCYSAVLSGLIYPVVVHWVWDSEGWLNGKLIDFAGSGVVHMVGGFAALWGAIIVKPRLGRFEKKKDAMGDSDNRDIEIEFLHHYVYSLPGHSSLLSALGVAILWVGWYGFNCGSTLAIGGNSLQGGKIAVVSTISAGTSAVTCTIIHKLWHQQYDLLQSLNGVLAGLVAICAGCSVVEPYAAFVIGFVAGCTFTALSYLLKRLQVDDPLDAFPVHGGCGMWGLLAAGIFPTKDGASFGGYGSNQLGGTQFGWQLVGVLFIAGWTSVMSLMLFTIIDKTIKMRVDDETQKKGLDIVEHGTYVYERRGTTMNQSTVLIGGQIH